MALIPLPLVASAVRKAMAGDPVGGGVLADEAVHTWLLEVLDSEADLVDGVIRSEALAKAAELKRALGRAYVESVSKGEYPDSSAEAVAGFVADLELVAKYETFTDADGKQYQWYGRRAADGTFARSIGSKPKDLRGASMLSPNLPQGLVGPVGGVDSAQFDALPKDTQEALNRHQDEWRQANEFVAQMYRDLGDRRDKVNVVIHRAGRDGEARDSISIPLKDGENGLQGKKIGAGFDPQLDQITEVRLDVSGAGVDPEVKNFNAMGLLFGRRGEQMAAAGGKPWRVLGQERPYGTRRSDDLFNRLSAGGAVLDAVPGAEKAAAFARLAGSLGPEADKVLGPHVQRAAYRYRGTEKTPDEGLAAAFASDEYTQIRALAGGDITPDELRGALDRVKARSTRPGQDVEQDPVLGSALRRVSAEGSDGDQLRLEVAADVAADHLIDTLPEDPFAARLSEKSGHVLPSQGVLINAEGELVSQAVGFADDHYLPFDLKNMGSLRGGQYVRTRVSGGLTGEDVYAAVQTGARKATVVSSSGVFSLEFAPDFRGARGNSDKARSMYDRYLKILDAVDSSDLYLQDIPKARRRELEQQAFDSVIPGPDAKANKQRVSDLTEKLVMEERRRGEALTADELDKLSADVDQELTGPEYQRLSTQARARLKDDMYTERADALAAERVQQLKLNAAGYEMALKTLQSQFPYFIRKVTYEPLAAGRADKDAGFLDARGRRTGRAVGRQRREAKDTGYVAPGGLRPRTVTPKSPDAPVEAAAPAAPAAADGGGAAPAAAAPAAAAGGFALKDRLAMVSQRNKDTLKESVLSAAAMLRSLQPAAGVAGGTPTPGVRAAQTGNTVNASPYEAVKGNKANILDVVIDDLINGYDTTPMLREPEVRDAMQDSAAVIQAVEQARTFPYPDQVASGKVDASAFGGAATPDEMKQRLAEVLASMAGSSTDWPFGAVGDADPVKAAFHRGSPREDPMLNELADPARVESVLRGTTYSRLGAWAGKLGWGDSPPPQKEFDERIEVLEKLYLAPEALNADEAYRANPMADQVEAVLTKANVPAEVAAKALGVEKVSAADLKQANVQQAAEDTQRAYTMLHALRLLKTLPGAPGKAPAPQPGPTSPDPSLRKSAPRPQGRLLRPSEAVDLLLARL